MIRQFCALAIVFVLVALSVESFAAKPCLYFNYELDGDEWIGVVKIYPHIYNQFHGTNNIILNISLVTNQPIQFYCCSEHNKHCCLQLYKSQQETLRDIADHKPIMYRLNFPRNVIPSLLEMSVNDVEVCPNHTIYHMSKISLGHMLPLASLPDPADIPQIIVQRGPIYEEYSPHKQNSKHHPHTTNSQCGTYDEDLYDDELKYTQSMSGDGGEKIAQGTWPWLVAISRKDLKGNQFKCTGTIISNRLVLTAAHCFKSNAKFNAISAEQIVLAFGQHDINDWTEENIVISDVEEIILHSDYLSKKESTIFDADIAILVVKGFIEFTSIIKPICLWPKTSDNKMPTVGTIGRVVGWDQQNENIEENVPRKLTLPVVRKLTCFPEKRVVNARRVFCAGTRKRGYAPCHGDSGSAFAIQTDGAWSLRGIASAALGGQSFNDCQQQTFAIYTDIIYFRSWIDSYM